MRNKKQVQTAGTVSATAGGVGTGFAACHTTCQVLISVLAIMGVTLIGMPLAFLQPYAVPLLLLSLASFGFSIWICRKHKMPLRTLLKPMGIGLLGALIIVLIAFSLGAVSLSTAPTAFIQDKCAPQPGYTEQEWTDHMGHHPEQYKECLKQSGEK